MPKRLKPGNPPSQGWYLREWMEHFGKRQVDLQKELNWSLGKSSEVYNGQPYRQELVQEVSGWLGIEPFELLMHPRQADNLRRLRETAIHIAELFEGVSK